MTHLDVPALNFVIGIGIPFLTGLVGKERSGRVRAILNGLLSAIAGAVTVAIAAGGNITWSQWLLGIALTWGSSVVAYHGLLNPTGLIDGVVERAAGLLAKVGIRFPVKTIETDLEGWLSKGYITEELLKVIRHDLHLGDPTDPPAPATPVP